jgi:hypothetical protein
MSADTLNVETIYTSPSMTGHVHIERREPDRCTIVEKSTAVMVQLQLVASDAKQISARWSCKLFSDVSKSAVPVVSFLEAAMYGRS